jgi:hypothetical protein
VGASLPALFCATAAAASPVLVPWSDPSGTVRIDRPATIAPSMDDKPLGALMSGGWMLDWDGTTQPPGRLLLRLAVAVKPRTPERKAMELLQIGVSRDRGAVSGCLRNGLSGPNERRERDRVFGSVRFTVRRNADAGMSQRIEATDLRAVVDGACYAVERFSYADSASDVDPSVTLPEKEGAALLDAALRSLRIGRPR